MWIVRKYFWVGYMVAFNGELPDAEKKIMDVGSIWISDK